MLMLMLCRSIPNPANTVQAVGVAVPVVTRALVTHNMITTIMKTAA